MTDAEVLERAMHGEYVGDTSRIAAALTAEIRRLRDTGHETCRLALDTLNTSGDFRGAAREILESRGIATRGMFDEELILALRREFELAHSDLRLAKHELSVARKIDGHPAVVEAVANCLGDIGGEPEEHELPSDKWALSAFLVHHERVTA